MPMEAFRTRMGLRVDEPRAGGSGNSNDGNTARRAFRSPAEFAACTSVDQELSRVCRRRPGVGPLEEPAFKSPDDDTTEVCGVRILNSDRHLNILNIYRPPIRNTEEDEREDRFDPRALPVDETTLLVGDVNAHHPLWDAQCEAADRVGQRIADWMDEVGWLPLNSGEPTHSSYRSGSSTAPDLAACSSGLARRASWRLGPDLGSDHLPMVVSVRTTPGSARRIRKTKPAFHKADWVAFREECEAALSEPPAPRCTAQSLATRFTEVLQRASGRHIPSGARADPKPWALDPELQLAIAERREARQLLRQDDPDSRVRWIAAKRRAAEVEQRVSRTHFREFVETTLNKPASLGRVSKILKKWEGASDDHRPGEAMTHNGRLLASDKEKAAAFIQTYAHVSRQVRVPKLDKEAKHKWTHNRPSSCHGSASGGITDGGAGAFIERPDGEVTELRIAAGRLCSSYRAEMIALQAAADYLTDNPAHEEDPIIFCTDSMAALARLREGPTAQTTPLGIQIWRAL
ncbi:hypothetical protein FJT64_015103 [Amphibalanus amphitrite]|uniref:Endonuclease/exonuclease/phosphatase domain-containing protein n=1 Tax=Amphibalanus amphitrite TaxID=1232801 RepID=A0A6A4XGA1_AMPAM|nr:hypothetical protein FJT64_015103 [Amphibalanus amphitrite]